VSPTPEVQALRDRFLTALLDAVRPLQNGADPEIVLEAMIKAVDLLEQRLRTELAGLRQELVD
jgi:hypothetical protein